MRRDGNKKKDPKDFFSPTELEVLRLGFLGLYESAFTLGVAAKTVSRHRTNIIGKIESWTQQETGSFKKATRIALARKIITRNEMTAAHDVFIRKVSPCE